MTEIKLVEITLSADQLEGTQASFSTWLVVEGERVEQGQPIAELETDKVAMEICASVSGVIQSLSANQGDKVEPEQCLGQIAKNATVSIEEAEPTDPQAVSANSNDRDLVSPAVRRLLRENNLNIDKIGGSGKRGRVTKDDIIKFLKTQQDNKTSALIKNSIIKDSLIESALIKNAPIEDSLIESAPIKATEQPVKTANRTKTTQPLQSKIIPHTKMRKSIANHMVSSLLETSPHVTSVFEMDMGNIIKHRNSHKKEYVQADIKLTFTAYFLAAMAKAVATVPQVNAKYHDDALEIFDDVNIGVGTALVNEGLVVPVVQQVQSMSLKQIAKRLNQQTEKARSGKLTPADMKNGTLTISNHGVSGSLFATPIIINQPQVAILGVGKLEKRVVVKQLEGEDVIQIRPKCYVSLSIDHRALDAHQTNLYLAKFVEIIENWDV